MEITKAELRELITEAATMGCLQAYKALRPETDEVKSRDIKAYLERMGYDTRTFNRLCREGVIRHTRKGDKPNSPIIYSRANIEEAFAVERMARRLAEHS